MITSRLCTQADLLSVNFRRWAHDLLPALPRFHLCDGSGAVFLHRKVWEWCYIARALEERGCLRDGRRGLGFAVGQEPLAAIFASRGCEVLATDLEPSRAGDWIATDQHASLGPLNAAGLCDDAVFMRRVSFRFVDMNAVPTDLAQERFDFLWSSCSIEHLGTVGHAQRFVLGAMRCLKPGGVAVHTTEYNVSSNAETIGEGPTVVLRRRDIESLADDLRRDGHRIVLDFADGTMPADAVVDQPPYHPEPHLKLQLGPYVVTSYGLVIQKQRHAMAGWWKSVVGGITRAR